MAQEPSPKRTTFVQDASGNIQEIDLITGVIVAESPSLEKALTTGDFRQLSPENPRNIRWHYNQVHGDMICELISRGKRMSQVCDMAGMPSASIINRWAVQNEDFDDALKAAKRTRAEYFGDLIAKDVEENPIDRDLVPGEKLKFDKLKYLASVDDPDKYGNRTKISGDKDQPLQVIFDTGIVRNK